MRRINVISMILCLVLFLSACAAPEALPAAGAATEAVEAPEASAPVPVPTPTVAPTAAPTPTPAPIDVKLYVPDVARDKLIRVAGVIAEDSPLALLDALTAQGAIPDVDYGRNLYFEVGDSFVKVRNRVRKPAVVARMDVGEAFIRALDGMDSHDEELILQSLANTFITYYDAETFMMTIEGVKLETDVRDYERGITFDQYIKTIGE